MKSPMVLLQVQHLKVGLASLLSRSFLWQIEAVWPCALCDTTGVGLGGIKFRSGYCTSDCLHLLVNWLSYKSMRPHLFAFNYALLYST